MSRKLKEKQQRRLAEEAKRARARKQHQRANLITLGIALLVLLLVAVLVMRGRSERGIGGNVGVAAAQAGCSDLRTFPASGNAEHRPTGTPIDYETNPPTTGPHWPPEAVANPGFYEEPVEPERLVHNQEHGQIVIYYDPDAPERVKNQLESLVGQDPVVNIAAPYEPGIPGHYNYTLTAWHERPDGSQVGVQQSCRLASQEVYDRWRRDYQGRGPENVGIPTFTGRS